jgi:hypothetical protein
VNFFTQLWNSLICALFQKQHPLLDSNVYAIKKRVRVFFSNPFPFYVFSLRMEGLYVKPKKQANIVHKQFLFIKTMEMLFAEQILTSVFRSYAK